MEPQRKYNEDEGVEPSIRPDLRSLQGGGETSEPKQGHLSSVPAGNDSDSKSESSKGLRALEGGGETSEPKQGHLQSVGANALKSGEENSENPMNFTGGKSNKNGNQKKGFWNKKRTGIAGGVAGALVGGGIMGISLISGPLQFLHMGQLLQQFHFTRTDDFGDDRGSKVLLYALLGKAERGRLGHVSNKAADIWEKKMLKETGLKPVYSSTTKRMVGFEIVDEDKARSRFGDMGPDQFGEGSKITTVDEASNGKQRVVGPGREKLSGSTRIVSVRDQSYKARRTVVRSVSKAMDTNKLVSKLASRLMIKRFGIDFHPLKNIKRKPGESFADYRSRVRQEKAEEARKGADPKSLGQEEGKDENGKPKESEAAKSASKDANKLIDKVSKNISKDAIKDAVGKGVGATAIVGVFCAVKGFGDDIPKYKFVHTALPMIRMGMQAVTIAGQIKSGQDVNMDELGALSQSFYGTDSTGQKSSWTDAKSIQAELGEKQTGPDLPSEDKLSNINGKPWIFSALDHIPGLGTACSVLSGISHIPIISNLSDGVSAVVSTAANAALGLFGTSINALMQKALAAAAGKTVNLFAEGADFGNIANVGTFLAGNDEAISMGGAAMTPTQTAQLRAANVTDLRDSRANESIAYRYLDPYNNFSLVGSIINHMPLSFGASVGSLEANIGNPFSSITGMFSNIFHSVSSPVLAATTSAYDYGVPTYGFTMSEQNNPEFADPYDNAAVVEPQLKNLNEEYSGCFGMKAVPSGDSVKLVNTEAPNVFDMPAKCKEKSDTLLRYRFYLADLASAKSMACYEANSTEACNELGFSGSSNTSTTTQSGSTPTAGGSAQALASAILQNPNIVLLASAKADITAASQGQKVTPGPIGGTSGGTHANTHGCTARTPVDLDATMLQAMLNIASKYKYQINDITSGHVCDSGRHPLGRAFDIFKVNGKPIDGHCTDSDIYGFLKYTANMMNKLQPNGQWVNSRPVNKPGIGSCNPAEDGSRPSWVPSNVNYFYDWHDEIHVDTGVAS